MRKEMSYNRMKMVKGVMILAGAAVLGGMVMWLWNCIMPDLLAGASKIDYWHALGLLLLCRILFGGFRGHGHGPGSWHEKREHWQRWQAMTPEEREQFHRQRANWCRPNNPEEKKDE